MRKLLCCSVLLTNSFDVSSVCGCCSVFIVACWLATCAKRMSSFERWRLSALNDTTFSREVKPKNASRNRQTPPQSRSQGGAFLVTPQRQGSKKGNMVSSASVPSRNSAWASSVSGGRIPASRTSANGPISGGASGAFSRQALHTAVR